MLYCIEPEEIVNADGKIHSSGSIDENSIVHSDGKIHSSGFVDENSIVHSDGKIHSSGFVDTCGNRESQWKKQHRVLTNTRRGFTERVG